MTQKPITDGQFRLLQRLYNAPAGRLPLDAVTGPEKTQMKALAARGLALPDETAQAWLITPAGRADPGFDVPL
jgi:hypothetical protein